LQDQLECVVALAIPGRLRVLAEEVGLRRRHRPTICDDFDFEVLVRVGGIMC
jgi:hypothetical protein